MASHVVKSWAAFTMMEPGVPYLNNAEMAFGDYDNDGDLDLATIGAHFLGGVYSNQARVFRNDGNWLFTPTDFYLGDFVDGGIAWGDYDKDGWLDLVMNGSPFIASVNGDMKLFHNDQGLGFTLQPFSFHDFCASTVLWADLDNDFDPDILCAGQNNTMGHNADLCLYYNLGAGEFAYNTLPTLPNFLRLPSLFLNTVDYDQDGYLDLCASGASNSSGSGDGYTLLWKHNPQGGFTSVFGNANPGGGGIVWFDYDRDYDLDLMYNGSEFGVGDLMILQRNDGATFTQIEHQFPAVYMGAMCAGDYDNDGDDDLFISGGTSAHCLASIYRQDSPGVYVAEDLGLHPLGESHAYWADLDNDSDLDLAYTGRGMGDATMFYRNECMIPNQPPTPPLLSYNPATGFLISGATDSATSVRSLTYDLRIGTYPGGADIYNPPADPASGFRRVPGSGRPNFSAHRLAPGAIYYAAAQAIDGGFMGSAWGPEICIDLSSPVQDNVQNPQISIYPNPCATELHIKATSSGATPLAGDIYNLKGQKVATLTREYAQGASGSLVWNCKDQNGIRAANGIYLLRITCGSQVDTTRILLLQTP